MPVTLLQINVAAIKASNGAIARDIGTMALARGWKSYIAYGRFALPCDSELIKVGNNIDIKIHGLLTRLFDIHGLGSVIVTYNFIRKIKKIRPDIVHLHNIHGYYINYKILFDYLNKKDIPVVWTFHDCWPFTGHCGYFELYNCDKWKKLCHDCPGAHAYPKSFFFDRSKLNYLLKKNLFTAHKKLHITTVSKWLKGLVEDSYFSNFPVDVVYDGIDTDAFCFRENELRKYYGLDNCFVLIAAAANWTSAKGWYDYIRLSSMLPKDCVIFLIGVKEEQKAELPSNIISVGLINGKEKLAEYFSMADILLNLSYQETFGMTTAEAMSCGTPGISYNKTACPELISPETGIVVEAGNMEQILSAINEIKKNGKSFYSKSCRKRVLDNFDIKNVNKAYFDIYENILKEQECQK